MQSTTASSADYLNYQEFLNKTSKKYVLHSWYNFLSSWCNYQSPSFLLTNFLLLSKLFCHFFDVVTSHLLQQSLLLLQIFASWFDFVLSTCFLVQIQCSLSLYIAFLLFAFALVCVVHIRIVLIILCTLRLSS